MYTKKTLNSITDRDCGNETSTDNRKNKGYKAIQIITSVTHKMVLKGADWILNKLERKS